MFVRVNFEVIQHYSFQCCEASLLEHHCFTTAGADLSSSPNTALFSTIDNGVVKIVAPYRLPLGISHILPPVIPTIASLSQCSAHPHFADEITEVFRGLKKFDKTLKAVDSKGKVSTVVEYSFTPCDVSL